MSDNQAKSDASFEQQQKRKNIIASIVTGTIIVGILGTAGYMYPWGAMHKAFNPSQKALDASMSAEDASWSREENPPHELHAKVVVHYFITQYLGDNAESSLDDKTQAYLGSITNLNEYHISTKEYPIYISRFWGEGMQRKLTLTRKD